MRRFLTPRWLGLHAAMVLIFAGFLALGWWQLTRAEGGNALSWGYTFEWPLFAGFVVVFWVRMMRDELREARERDAAAAQEDGAEPAAGAGSEPLTLPAGARAWRFEPGSGQRAAQDPDDAGDADDAELAAYNAYLAQLNAQVGTTQAGTTAGAQGGRFSGHGGLRHGAAWRARAEPPAGDVEV